MRLPKFGEEVSEMLRGLLFFPICIARGLLFPVLAVGAIIATVVYAASKSAE
jgi:hypothetical protein